MMNWLVRRLGPACSNCGVGSLLWLCTDCEVRLSLAHLKTSGNQTFGYRYSPALSAWLHRIKDDCRIELIQDLSQIPCPPSLPVLGRLTWIPSDPDLRRKRLFDPAEELAKRLARLWNRSLIPSPFVRDRYLVPLKRMNRLEREALLPRIICLDEGAVPPPETTVVLIDDLTTTGASFEHCAGSLRSRGLEVHGYSLLRAL